MRKQLHRLLLPLLIFGGASHFAIANKGWVECDRGKITMWIWDKGHSYLQATYTNSPCSFSGSLSFGRLMQQGTPETDPGKNINRAEVAEYLDARRGQLTFFDEAGKIISEDTWRKGNNLPGRKSNAGGTEPVNRDALKIYAGGGLTAPSTAGKDSAALSNAAGFNLELYKPLYHAGSFSIGVSAGGDYSNSSGDAPAALPAVLNTFNQSSATVAGTQTGNSKGFRIGAGPQADFRIGRHFVISPVLQCGYQSLTEKSFTAIQTTNTNGKINTYTLLAQTETKTSGFALTPRLRLQYFFSRRIGLWADGSYVAGPTIKSTISTFTPNGNPSPTGQYETQQLQQGTILTRERTTKYTATGINGGLVFAIGGRTRKKIFRPADLSAHDENPVPDTEPEDRSCPEISSPRNGSTHSVNQNVHLEIISKNAFTGTAKVYKISGDKDYGNKSSGENTAFPGGLYESAYEQASKTMGFAPMPVSMTKKGSAYATDVAAGKLSEGTYVLVVTDAICGITTSSFSISTAGCGTNKDSVLVRCKAWVNGAPTYSVTVIFSNIPPMPGGQQCTTVMNSITSPNGTISGISGLPATIPIGGNAPPVTFTYTAASPTQTTGAFYYGGIWNDGNSNTSNFNNLTVKLPSCVCSICDGIKWQSNQSSSTIQGNSLNIVHSVSQTYGSLYTLIGAKAEIVAFERYVGDECMSCNKDAALWANFTSGTLGATAGGPGTANNGVGGNTHHTLYWNSPATASPFSLNISLPPLSALSCCCDKVVVTIRYTFSYKDKNGACISCSKLYRYTAQKGSCPGGDNPGGTANPQN